MPPQMPQLVVVLSGASQPVATLLSQLPNPLVQAIEHAPRLHEGVPLVLLQALPQTPQLPALVCVFVSHPLAAVPSQLPKPVVQDESVHVPVAQDGLAFEKLQGTPHPPQFVKLLSCVSQPLPELPSQSPKPAVQLEIPQTPFTQLGVPPAAEQT